MGVSIESPRSAVPTVAEGSKLARFLVAVGLAYYADWVTTVALVVLVYRATGSAAAPALYILARVAPRVLGPAPGGALADRVGPIRVAALSAIAQGFLTAGLVLLAHGGIVWAIYPVVAVAQFLNALAQPALGAVLPRLSRADQLGRVNGMFNGLYWSSILVGPALGALLLPFMAPEVLVAAGSVGFLIAAALLVTLSSSAPAVEATSPRGMRAGFAIVMRDGTLRAVVAGCLGNAAVVTSLQAVLVVAAAQHFGRDTNVGWLYAAVGAGGLLGSLSFLRRTPLRIRRTEIVAFTALELVPLAGFVLVGNLIAAAALLFVSSLGGVLYQTLGAIGLQQLVPTDMLGRATAVLRTALFSGMLIGAIAAIALVQPLGWQSTVLIVCAASLALLIGTSLTGPRRRSPNRPRKSRRHVSTF